MDLFYTIRMSIIDGNMIFPFTPDDLSSFAKGIIKRSNRMDFSVREYTLSLLGGSTDKQLPDDPTTDDVVDFIISLNSDDVEVIDSLDCSKVYSLMDSKGQFCCIPISDMSNFAYYLAREVDREYDRFTNYREGVSIPELDDLHFNVNYVDYVSSKLRYIIVYERKSGSYYSDEGVKDNE